MEIKGVIQHAESDRITIKTKDSVNVQELRKHTINGHLYALVDVYERDTITELQRKHFFALCGDYEMYTGVPIEAVTSWFKVKFMQEAGLDELPSLARNRMKKSTASELLEFMITYMIQNGIPFRKQQFYLTTDQNKMLYALTMKRLCWVCGKPHSDLHHATNLVGMGRKRSRHEHTQSKFMCLCRQHHNEVHQLGLSEFREKHHLKEIKLNRDDLKTLGIIGGNTNE